MERSGTAQFGGGRGAKTHMVMQELDEARAQQAATAAILRAISRSPHDAQPIFDLIANNAARLCQTQYCHVFRFDGRLLHVVAHHGLDSAGYEAVRASFPVAPDRGTAAGRAILSGAIEQLPDVSKDKDYLLKDVAGRAGFRSSVAVPMIPHDAPPLGVITVMRSQTGLLAERYVELLKTFADQAVIAIENVRRFKALQARTEEVRVQAQELQALNADLEGRVAKQVEQLERLGRLRRFLSPQVADAVVSSGDEKLLTSHRALIATLFCDIRGFTAFCETAEPEETIEVLQTYHEEMGKLIAAHGAGVDHRSGDGIMVIFNDPLPCEDPAGDAVRLAIAMRARMAELSQRWKRLGHRLGFGVGISLGYATAGMVGAEGRYEYTASGTAVNLASRLCNEAEDGEILLSPRAYAAVEGNFDAETRGELDLKGITAPVEVYRVAGRKPA